MGEVQSRVCELERQVEAHTNTTLVPRAGQEDSRLGESTRQGRHRWLGGLFTRGHNSCCC